MPPNQTKYISEYREFAKNIAMEAGAIIKSNLQLGISRTWKSDDTPVTLIDKQINDLVLNRIHAHFPEHSILAEEGSDLTRSSQYVWVCDPIDGTFPFMHGIPVSTFTLALVQDGVPILSLIYDPYMDRMFFATENEPTTLNGTQIHTSQNPHLEQASIGVIFWKENMSIFTPLIQKLTDIDSKIIDLCSVAYMDSLVACGELSAVIFPGSSAHDSASAKLIIENAGGVFTSLSGEVDRYDQSVHGHIAAANHAVYDQIRSFLG